MNSSWRSVPPVVRGDCIGVVAPSGPLEPALFERGLAWLRERYSVRVFGTPTTRDGYFAGNDLVRANSVCDALEDTNVRALIASRGGYGAMRVLETQAPRIRSLLQQHPKMLAGFSDITALHAVWTQEHVRSIHAPMLSALGAPHTVNDCEALEQVLAGKPSPAFTSLNVLSPGRARGRAVGSNLSMLAAVLSTPFAMPLENAVLFLEDVGERPYRVDRLLTTLRIANVFRSVRAVVLGEFVDCGKPDEPPPTVADVLRERLGDLGIPVLANAPFGHGTRPGVIAWGDTVDVIADGPLGQVVPVV